MKTIEERASRRVHFGLQPDVYDSVEVLYPSDTVEVYIYTLLADDGTSHIRGYVEVTYTDATKDKLLKVTRLADV